MAMAAAEESAWGFVFGGVCWLAQSGVWRSAYAVGVQPQAYPASIRAAGPGFSAFKEDTVAPPGDRKGALIAGPLAYLCLFCRGLGRA